MNQHNVELLYSQSGEELSGKGERKEAHGILVVDDDQSLREFLDILLSKEGYRVYPADSGENALEILKSHKISMVISDIRMPGMDGMSLLKTIKTLRPEMPVVLITAFASMDSAVTAMKEGAWDYLTKPFRIEELREIIERALAAANASETPSHDQLPTQQAGKVHRLDQMVARSPAMLKLFQIIPRIAATNSSVLITGETGTGKELAARAVHNLGPRKDRPFVVVNCGGIPENLLESELFGHTRGAFTGASQEKKGLFAMAHTGTIFLDEIGELPMLLQVKLLRVAQQKAFTPVGSTKPVEVDVRIIAATNRDLEQEVMNGNFREDLFYRLNVIQIKMPPLRERPEDIPLLVQYFLDKYSKEQGKKMQGISSYAIEALMDYQFPGNVRELENIIERSVALSTSNLLLPESLSLAKFKEEKQTEKRNQVLPPDIPDEGMVLDDLLSTIEKEYLMAALNKSRGKKTEAASLLGMNFRSFRYRLSKYGL